MLYVREANERTASWIRASRLSNYKKRGVKDIRGGGAERRRGGGERRMGKRMRGGEDERQGRA